MKAAISITKIWVGCYGMSRSSKIAFHVGIFLLAFLVLFSRRPDAILNPQFYAEDGTYWYVNAYQSGFRCLLMPNGGFFYNLFRFICLFALVVSFSLAPPVVNFRALSWRILPLNIFLS